MLREIFVEVKDFIRRLFIKNLENRFGVKSVEEVKKYKFFKVRLNLY